MHTTLYKSKQVSHKTTELCTYTVASMMQISVDGRANNDDNVSYTITVGQKICSDS